MRRWRSGNGRRAGAARLNSPSTSGSGPNVIPYKTLFADTSALRCHLHLRASDCKPMRIAIVTESFPPAVNGVANSVVRVADHLVARGHQPLVRWGDLRVRLPLWRAAHSTWLRSAQSAGAYF